MVLPCGEGVLTKNLGVPIVVVCNKADGVEMLEKEYSYKDDIFVYIQQHLRRICLSCKCFLLPLSSISYLTNFFRWGSPYLRIGEEGHELRCASQISHAQPILFGLFHTRSAR